MAKVRFANILLEHNPRSVEFPSIYCKSDVPWICNEESRVYELSGAGTFDFTTYFNALAVNKLRRYASATSFSLDLDIKGAACKVVQTTADVFASCPQTIEDNTVDIEASNNWTHVSLNLVASEQAILVGFIINTEGKVYIRDGHYTVAIDRELRDVNLLLSTTTFRKEGYVLRNVNLLKSKILASDEDIAMHFGVLIVDNGRTLDAEALADDGIAVCPNDNVGGAGGFARGMIEALESPFGYTHVLLMDDDVAISPESVKRTYNLLRIANEDYTEAFISGAMLNYEAGNEQWEDTGYMTPEGYCHPAKERLCLTKFEDVVYNEAHRVTGDARRLHQRYAAWWYCCIPVAMIKKNGLPLPYFVRYDDAEYGIRCSPEFMTMGGICIWHDPFDKRYNAANELYQTTRNELIAQFTTGFAKNSDFETEIYHKLTLELKKFSYDNAELVLDAFEDFLKGPEFYSGRGVAEMTFMAANRNKEKYVSLTELEDRARELGVVGFDLSQIDRQLIDGDKPRTLPQRLIDYTTDNGQRIGVTKGEGFAVIPSNGGVYPAGIIRGKKYLIVIDWYNRSGAVRVKDAKRYAQIQTRYKNDLKTYKKNKQRLSAEYANSRERVTSVEFWKSYLGLN